MTDGNSGHERRPRWYSSGTSRGDFHDGPAGSEPAYPSEQSQRDNNLAAAQVGGFGVNPEYAAHPGYGGAGYSSAGYAPASYTPPGYGYYSPTPGTDALEEMRYQREEKARGHHTASVVLAIIGFFTLPILLGPLAIWQATKARNLGHPGVAGMVLGWIVVVWAFTGWFFGFVMMFLVGIVATAG